MSSPVWQQTHNHACAILQSWYTQHKSSHSNTFVAIKMNKIKKIQGGRIWPSPMFDMLTAQYGHWCHHSVSTVGSLRYAPHDGGRQSGSNNPICSGMFITRLRLQALQPKKHIRRATGLNLRVEQLQKYMILIVHFIFKFVLMPMIGHICWSLMFDQNRVWLMGPSH
jgi:hypothetical protein